MSLSQKNKPKIDMTGFRSGRLLVVSFHSVHPKSRKARWNCICDCGNTCVVQQDLLKAQHTRSCGCIKREMYDALKIEYGLAAKRSVYIYYQNNARQRNLVFSLEFDYFIELSQQKCFYCGREPFNVMRTRSRNGDFIYNGIDRINSQIGYIPGNCVPCCSRCNEAKMDLTLDEFMDWIEKVHANIGFWNRQLSDAGKSKIPK